VLPGVFHRLYKGNNYAVNVTESALCNVKEDRDTVEVTYQKSFYFQKMATLEFQRKETRRNRTILHLGFV
jgi:hypothetical protein